jgi:hypothetical protein
MALRKQRALKPVLLAAIALVGCATLLGIEEGTRAHDGGASGAGATAGTAGAAGMGGAGGGTACPDWVPPPRAYHGAISLDDGELETDSVPLCVSRERAVLFFGVRHALDEPGSTLVRGELDPDGALKFTRGDAKGRLEVSWHVLEHPALSVRHGASTLDAAAQLGSSSKTETIDLTSDEFSRSFPVISYSTDPGDSWEARHHVSVSMPSAVHLRLEARAAGAQVAWQIVTLPAGSLVQQDATDFDASFTASKQLKQDRKLAASVPLDRSFLLFSQHALDDTASNTRQWAFDGVLSFVADGGASYATFSRAEAGADFRVHWFVVELGAGFANVQHATFTLLPSFPSSVTPDDPLALQAIDAFSSTVFASSQRHHARVRPSLPVSDGGVDAGQAPRSGDLSFTLELFDSKVRLKRELSDAEVRIHTQVLSF